jgi:acylphosphatase
MPSVARLQIHGKVQGVFFRQSTRQEAQTLGVLGYVRNLPDGSVEVCAGGERSCVEKLVEFCRKGPSRADVQKLDMVWQDWTDEDYEREFTGNFEIR